MTGSLLVAHPSLTDSNFRRTIVFLSHHSADEGATGLVVNRPLGESLSDLPGLQPVPVFFGGPVQTSEIILASLQWRSDPTVVAFRTFPGPIGNLDIEPEWHPGLRAFAGYSGWTRGQLEGEIEEKAWIVIPPTRELLSLDASDSEWKFIMRQTSPLLHLLSEAPDHPELN